MPKEDSKNEKNAAQNHYLPHHAVVRKDRETTKVRIVYDGSAKSGKQEKSLNDCLETGPNHIPHVFNMLANFRKNPVGITADTEMLSLWWEFKKIIETFFDSYGLETQLAISRRLYNTSSHDSCSGYAPRLLFWERQSCITYSSTNKVTSKLLNYWNNLCTWTTC